MRVPHRVEAAACRSGSHMVRNHSCCTATANCLFAPYLSIYSLVALVSLYRPECNHLSVEYAFPIMTNQNLTRCHSDAVATLLLLLLLLLLQLGAKQGQDVYLAGQMLPSL